MSNPRIDFLYLDEPSMVKAGVTDMHHCVEVMEEVYMLMGKGDYIMGGKNRNSHGVKISFPKTSDIPTMPLDGPDRRFMAMVAYLGGRFNVAGEKWYGSNRTNMEKGLPRSILMTMLNNAETGAPEALMSANLVSAMRTGAIPGVGAKYLARKDSKVCAIIGAGVIGRTCMMSLIDVCHNLDTIKIYDLFPATAEKLKVFIQETYPQITTIEIVDSLQAACEGADVINAATSGEVSPNLKAAWLKKGAFLSLPAGIDMDEDFVLSGVRNVVDLWKMYESWTEELTAPYKTSLQLIGAHYADLINEGKMQVSDVEDLGPIVAGLAEGRKNDDEIIMFGMGGLPVYDVAWSYEILQNARKMGLGVSLNLWETPHLY